MYVEYCRKSLRQFLKRSWGDNPQQAAVLYSPANLYLVLGMLTEMSDGRTREQILSGTQNTSSFRQLRH